MDKVNTYVQLFERLEEAIVLAVTQSTGIKGVELVLKVMTKMMPLDYKLEEYSQILQSLVIRGEIVELEYTVPQTPDRIKSIYFPKGTKITI